MIAEIVKEKLAGKKGARLAVVRALFRNEITSEMEEVARKRAAELNAKVVGSFLVRGSMEIPLVAKAVLKKKDVDGVVALGAVIKGETLHDEVVVENASRELMAVSMESGKPVGIGIIGPGVSMEQAKARVKEYAEGAVDAVVLSNETLKEV